MLELIIIFIFLILSAELISKGTEKLEPFMGQGMAGGIIMGLLTALPETIFVIVASLRNQPYVALGSAIGGNVLLFTFGIGFLGVYFYLRWRKNLSINEDYSVEERFLIITTIALAIILLYGHLNLYTAIPLLGIYLYYAIYRVRKFTKENRDIDEKEVLKAAIYLIIGAFILIIFSDPFVEELASLSKQLGVPAVWLALIISPLAGEIEETLSAIRLAHSYEAGGSLAIFDFVGSKIQNGTVLLGIIGLFSDISIMPGLNELIATLVVNVIAIMILMDKKLGVKESIVLLFLYFLIATMTLYL
ncbi:sodium:calcium antiporter [Sulfolobus sp. S-194]|uniref:sodium:calcium antiporter n=1 Tax=Sulfolobus sp. S-194 TaxID=2512240 RepID=UPI002570538B|nr:sodium:calcium antiporter [Sulfolobus sp. S-194]